MKVELISGRLQTERMANGHRKLIRDLILKIEGQIITVPTGTETDFSSIPRLGRMFLRWSRVDVAGVVHDWLYQCGSISRSEADRVWRLVALSGEHHANAIQAWTGWLLLRIFGFIAWYICRSDARKLSSCDG